MPPLCGLFSLKSRFYYHEWSCYCISKSEISSLLLLGLLTLLIMSSVAPTFLLLWKLFALISPWLLSYNLWGLYWVVTVLPFRNFSFSPLLKCCSMTKSLLVVLMVGVAVCRRYSVPVLTSHSLTFKPISAKINLPPSAGIRFHIPAFIYISFIKRVKPKSVIWR